MQVEEAFAEFAHLLSVGSAALGNMIDKVEPNAGGGRARELLTEVEAMGVRLREIASEIERLAARS